MMKIKVTIIIPVYNVSDYIERCVKSVMDQTYDNIECIIVDDATPDDSISKCENMIKSYHGLIVFSILHHSNNKGLSAARNTGTDAAVGDYIFYLDSDDEITSESIRQLTRPILEDTTIEMVLGNVKYYSDCCPLPSYLKHRKKRLREDIVSLQSVRNSFFKRNIFPVAAWNKLIKRTFLNEYQLRFQEGLLHEDRIWNYFVLKELAHIYIIPDVTYLYHLRPKSITTGARESENSRHLGIVYEIISNNLTEGERGIEVKCYLRDFCINFIKYSQNQSFFQSANRFNQVLAEEHYQLERILLLIIVFLMKLSFIRAFVRFAIYLRKVIRQSF